MRRTKIKKRKLSWDDIKRIVEFKTFYLMIILTLAGVVFLFAETWFFPKGSDSAFKGTFSALGITLITSSTISFIIEIFMRLDIVDFMTARMISILPEELKKSAGVTEFHTDRAKIDFKEVWEKSEGYLKIIGLSANDILSPAIMPELTRKIKRNPDFPLQILLLNPWSLMALRRSRAKVYGTDYECVRRIYDVIKELHDVYKNLELYGIDMSKIEVRLYDDIPSLSMVINERYAIVTPFTISLQGGSSPYFIAKNLETDDCIFSSYSEHFNVIWDRATPIIGKACKEYADIYLHTIEVDKDRANSLLSDLSAWKNKVL